MNSQELLDLLITQIKAKLKNYESEITTNTNPYEVAYLHGNAIALIWVEDILFNLKETIWEENQKYPPGLNLVKD